MGLDPATLLGGASAASSLIGGGKGAHQQQQNNQSANQLFSTESGAIQQLLDQYFGQGAPALQGVMNGTSPGSVGMARTAGSLSNLGPIMQPEINDLSSRMLASGGSTVNTLMSREGGMANPNSMATDLFTQNRASADRATTSMEAQLGGQELAGLEGAGSLYSGMNDNVLRGVGAMTGPLESGMGGLSQLGGTYANAASNMGNPLGAGINSAIMSLSQLFGGGGGGSNPFGWNGQTLSPI